MHEEISKESVDSEEPSTHAANEWLSDDDSQDISLMSNL